MSSSAHPDDSGDDGQWTLVTTMLPYGFVPRPRFTPERKLAFALLGTIPLLWYIRPAFVTSTVESGLQLLKSDEVTARVVRMHAAMSSAGIPPPYPGANELALTLLVLSGAAVFYFLLIGKSHVHHRWKLEQRLSDARREVEMLTMMLHEEEARTEKEQADATSNACVSVNLRVRAMRQYFRPYFCLSSIRWFGEKRIAQPATYLSLQHSLARGSQVAASPSASSWREVRKHDSRVPL